MHPRAAVPGLEEVAAEPWAGVREKWPETTPGQSLFLSGGWGLGVLSWQLTEGMGPWGRAGAACMAWAYLLCKGSCRLKHGLETAGAACRGGGLELGKAFRRGEVPLATKIHYILKQYFKNWERCQRIHDEQNVF